MFRWMFLYLFSNLYCIMIYVQDRKNTVISLLIRGAPDSDFYYPVGYRFCRISEKKSGRIPDILFNLNTRMSAKKDQIYLSASYIGHM